MPIKRALEHPFHTINYYSQFYSKKQIKGIRQVVQKKKGFLVRLPEKGRGSVGTHKEFEKFLGNNGMEKKAPFFYTNHRTKKSQGEQYLGGIRTWQAYH